MDSSLPPHPLTIERESFEGELAALVESDLRLAPLRHAVSEDAPAGVIEDLVTAVDSAPAFLPSLPHLPLVHVAPPPPVPATTRPRPLPTLRVTPPPAPPAAAPTPVAVQRAMVAAPTPPEPPRPLPLAEPFTRFAEVGVDAATSAKRVEPATPEPTADSAEQAVPPMLPDSPLLADIEPPTTAMPADDAPPVAPESPSAPEPELPLAMPRVPDPAPEPPPPAALDPEPRRLGLGAPLSPDLFGESAAPATLLPRRSEDRPALGERPLLHEEPATPELGAEIGVPTPDSPPTSEHPPAPKMPLSPAESRAPKPAAAPRRAPAATTAPAVAAAPPRAASVQRAPATGAPSPISAPTAAAPRPGPSLPLLGSRPLASRIVEQVPAAVRAHVEQTVGSDLGDVRVHRGEDSTQHAAALDARAFTSDGEVHLPAAHGRLDRGPAQALLAHELVHVAQQKRMGDTRPAEHTDTGQRLEREAQAVEHHVARQVDTATNASTPLPLPRPAATKAGPEQHQPFVSPAQVAVDAGIASRAADGSVVFDVPPAGAPAPPPPQRAVNAETSNSPAGVEATPENIDVLYDKIRRRLKDELRLNRQRLGMNMDFGR